MGSESARRPYLDGVTDNRRWDVFNHRSGDIIVATPAKCGTTWTQTIVSSLLWPDSSPPDPVVIMAPWLDGRIEPLEMMGPRLEAQKHRRSIKTHTPADGVPWWPTARYVVVLRDGRDAFMSLLNHMAKMRPEVVAVVNEQALEAGGQPLEWTGDVHADFTYWLAAPDNAPAYLASWWPKRRESNVLMVHFNDLKADLDGEMARISKFLGIEIPQKLWPQVVERCTFESMKSRGDEIGPFEMIFEGGAQSFLFKGTNGRWRDVLTEDELVRYKACVEKLLSPAAAAWLEHGSLKQGKRPDVSED